MPPKVIISQGREYRLCEGFYLQRSPKAADLARPPAMHVLSDIEAFHEALGVPNSRTASCMCCCCRPPRENTSVEKNPAEVWLSRPQGHIAPPLNMPPGHRWIRIGPGLVPTPVQSESLRPVYASSEGFFAVDPRSLVVERVRDKHGHFKERRRNLPDVQRLDLTKVQHMVPRDKPVPDLRWVPVYSPAATVFAQNWHLEHIGVAKPYVRQISSQDRGCGAVIDVEIFDAHLDFVESRDVAYIDRIYVGTAENAADPNEPDAEPDASPDASVVYARRTYHGTRVAGVMVARPEGPSRTDGVEFEAIGVASGGKLFCYDVDDWNFRAIQDALVEVINNERIKVLNMSFAYYGDGAQPVIPAEEAEVLDEMLYEAHERGVLLCAAAGNALKQGVFPIGWPAQNPHVIAVGAIDNDDRRYNSGWSSCALPLARRGFCKGVSVVAPGFGIVTPNGPTDGSGEMNVLVDDFCGTSAAAPQVASLAMLLIDKYELDNRQARYVIEATARKITATQSGRSPSFTWREGFGTSTYDDELGYGCIDVKAALEFADLSCCVEAVLEGKAMIIVYNDGPADASSVRLHVWSLDVAHRSWTLRRTEGVPATTADPAAPATYTLETRSSAAQAGTMTMSVDIASRAWRRFEVDVSSENIVVVADATADHAFRLAHIGGEIYSMNSLPYNNIAQWPRRASPVRPLQRPETQQ